jgi:hypothetical protein
VPVIRPDQIFHLALLVSPLMEEIQDPDFHQLIDDICAFTNTLAPKMNDFKKEGNLLR